MWVENIPTSHLESVRVAVVDLDGEEGLQYRNNLYCNQLNKIKLYFYLIY